ncbi:MAG: SDR family oxidoreductase [Balneolaceae bacterium]|nr:MAG: SDR family oxidoreductase [Balneolaceae bacterium]
MIYKDSSVLITGASQGIGRSIALAFAGASDRPLILLARNEQNLLETEKLCRQAGAERVHILPCDATSAEETGQLVIPEGFPEPGVIVNNAGSYLYKTLAQTSELEFRAQLDTNLYTAVNVTNRFLPGLHRLDRALIVNICSVASLKGFGDSGAYAAAKHALLGYTRSLRQELMHSNIAVTAINLGQTHSTSWAESDMSPEKLIDPKDVASLILAVTALSERSVVEELSLQPQGGKVAPM